MTTAVSLKRRTVPVYGFKVIDAGQGLFSAYVAVFNNVDYANERIRPGFFTKSLASWRASGDPIPVIFSHQWDTLASHVGIAMPADVQEVPPGAPGLPEMLKTLGGLFVARAQLDIDEQGPAGDNARALFKRMQRRSIKEFSFAYDATAQELAQDGAIDLIEGDLIELGPTLKGMNPDTQLIQTRSRKERPVADAKVWAELRGSDEERRDALLEAASEAFEPDQPTFGDAPVAVAPYVCVEGVWDDHVVVSVDDFDSDPPDYWDFPYLVNGDGSITLGAGTPVDVSVVLTPTTVDDDDDPVPSTGVTTTGDASSETMRPMSMRSARPSIVNVKDTPKAPDNRAHDDVMLALARAEL